MSFVSKLVKAGALVGAAYAAVKVSEKIKANHPEGLKTTSEKAEAVKEAASEVIAEAKQVYAEKAPEIKESVNSTVIRAADVARNYAPGVLSKVQSAVQTVADKAQGFADTLTDEPTEADFAPVDDQPAETVEEAAEDAEVKKCDTEEAAEEVTEVTEEGKEEGRL